MSSALVLVLKVILTAFKCSKLGTREELVSSFGCKPGTQRALHGFAQQRLTEAESKPTKLPVNPKGFQH